MSGAIFFNFGHKYVWWCTSQTDIGSCRQRHLSSLLGRCDMIKRDKMGEREYGDGDRNGWRLDHSRLIGGVNNSVQRRLLSSHPFSLLKCFDDAERISVRDWAEASSKSVFLMWLVMACKCSGVKFLVFSQFTATLDVLQHILQVTCDV